MCGRYFLVQKIETLEKRFNLDATDSKIQYEPNYNIGIGDKALVIADDDPKHLQWMYFGFIPSWAKTKTYLFNARSEGDRNKENDPNYKGAKDIINKKSFMKPIRSQRCIIPADGFYEGPKDDGGLKKHPHVIYLKDKKRPFAFAGIYNVWKDEEGIEQKGFAIITTTANHLLLQIRHPRSPVILNRSHEQRWLRKDEDLSRITELLHPYPPGEMNAYPVAPIVSDRKTNDATLLQPIGQRLYSEKEYKVSSHSGFGGKKREQNVRRLSFDEQTIYERIMNKLKGKMKDFDFEDDDKYLKYYDMVIEQLLKADMSMEEIATLSDTDSTHELCYKHMMKGSSLLETVTYLLKPFD